MSDSPSVHVVGSDTPLRRRVVADLGVPARPLGGASDLAGAEPGVVLVTEEGELVPVLRATAGGEGEWTVCLVEDEGERVRVRTVSIGWVEGLGDVEAYVEGDEDRLLELRRVVERMGRARHDINNPLTSGMAEVQILLMDLEDPDLREAVSTVQTQLRRIRDLVAGTKGIRAGED